jgi:hypothetical protein
MSRIIRCGIGALGSIFLLSSGATAQGQPGGTDHAPVPRQVLTARSVFIANGGSESYGAESYFRLTKYDGGPNRAYDSFYGAVKDWGHYELVGSTDAADVSFVIRFTNPVVDRGDAATTSNVPHEWVYDPQLNLSIEDPKTGLPLWAITEHIEPANDRAADNRHFDEAVTRLVDDLERLILSPDGSVVSQAAVPPGAVRVEVTRRRRTHAFVGSLLGGLVGGYAGSRTANYACNDNYMLPPLPAPSFFPNTPLPDITPPTNFDCDFRRGQTKLRNEFIGTLGGAVIGSLIGWIWPVKL